MNLIGLKRAGLVLSATCLGLALVPTVVASAAPSEAGNCVARALPSGSSATPTVKCFATFSSAITYATDGKVHLRNAARARFVSESEMSGATAATVNPTGANTRYVLTIDYVDANFQGNTLTWYQSAKCGSFASGSMPSGWNDVVTSLVNYSGCASTLFWNIHFGQPTYLTHVGASVARLGSFNDRTSSQDWCTHYGCTNT